MVQEQSKRLAGKNNKIVVVAERFKFSKRNQGENETIINYVNDLKILAKSCEFGSFLEDALRDKFVFGIRDENVQESLLLEDFTFEEALTFALEQHREIKSSFNESEVKEEVNKCEDVEVLNYSLDVKDELTLNDLHDEAEKVQIEVVNLKCDSKLTSVFDKESYDIKKKQFQCDICDYVTFTNSKFIRHSRTHTGEKPYICQTCKASYSSSKGLQRHTRRSTTCEDYNKQVELQKQAKFKELICDFCSKSFMRKSFLERHLWIHTGKKPFNCSFCKKSFTRTENLRQHMKTHVFENCSLIELEPITRKPVRPPPEEKSYQCKDCNQIFLNRIDLQNHLKDDIGIKICDPKDKMYIKEDLETSEGNQNDLHSQLYKCYNCSYTTLVKNNLKEHVKIHFRIKSFLCHICDYKSSKNSCLQVHIKRHNGVKNFVCELCNFKSVTYSNLKRHAQIHTGQKLHICEVCGYKTYHSSLLKVHSRIHTGEKPFACTICNYRSAERTSLRNHVRIHTGEKPFCCKFCDYRAAQRTGLAYHLKSHKRKQEKQRLEEATETT